MTSLEQLKALEDYIRIPENEEDKSGWYYPRETYLIRNDLLLLQLLKARINIRKLEIKTGEFKYKYYLVIDLKMYEIDYSDYQKLNIEEV